MKKEKKNKRTKSKLPAVSSVRAEMATRSAAPSSAARCWRWPWAWATRTRMWTWPTLFHIIFIGWIGRWCSSSYKLIIHIKRFNYRYAHYCGTDCIVVACARAHIINTNFFFSNRRHWKVPCQKYNMVNLLRAGFCGLSSVSLVSVPLLRFLSSILLIQTWNEMQQSKTAKCL